MGSETAGDGARGHASEFPWSKQSQTTHKQGPKRGSAAARTADADTKQWGQKTARGSPMAKPGRKGRGGGTGLAVEEDRELPVQCLHSHAYTNRTLDSLNNVDRSVSKHRLVQSPHGGDTVTLCTIVVWGAKPVVLKEDRYLRSFEAVEGMCFQRESPPISDFGSK